VSQFIAADKRRENRLLTNLTGFFLASLHTSSKIQIHPQLDTNKFGGRGFNAFMLQHVYNGNAPCFLMFFNICSVYFKSRLWVIIQGKYTEDTQKIWICTRFVSTRSRTAGIGILCKYSLVGCINECLSGRQCIGVHCQRERCNGAVVRSFQIIYFPYSVRFRKRWRSMALRAAF